MKLEEINKIEDSVLYSELEKCCGSSNWIIGMMNCRPFRSEGDLMEKADTIWERCENSDAMEAFLHHPKIGDQKSLENKFKSTQDWAEKEQSGVDSASSEIIERLFSLNQDYLDKFGYIFIVFATGKSAQEMLNILESRLLNELNQEIEIAMAEQHKITKLRLKKLIK